LIIYTAHFLKPLNPHRLSLATSLPLYVRRPEKGVKRSGEMTVKEVFTEQVTTCQPETNLAAASALLWEKDCGALPVLNEMGELAGIVTDRDICIALGTRNRLPSEVTVREVMVTGTFICRSSDDIRSALQIMREAKVRRLPVVRENGVLEGIVSVSDIILNARRGFVMAGSTTGVSNTDLVPALQAICSRASRISIQSAAA
jgi:CBS domain-containing protein